MARDERIDIAEAALGRGDHVTAAQVLATLAAAGVTRAQFLIGQAKEAQANKEQRSGQSPSFNEAYMWYGVAARRGEPGALAARDRVAAKLQPMEIEQADKTIEGLLRPRTEPRPNPGR